MRYLFKIYGVAKAVLSHSEYKAFCNAKAGGYVDIATKNKVANHVNKMRIALNYAINGKKCKWDLSTSEFRKHFNMDMLAESAGLSKNKMRQVIFEGRELTYNKRAVLDMIERGYWEFLSDFSKINFKSK